MAAWRYATVGCRKIWHWYQNVGPAEPVRAAIDCTRNAGGILPAVAAALPLVSVAPGYVAPSALYAPAPAGFGAPFGGFGSGVGYGAGYGVGGAATALAGLPLGAAALDTVRGEVASPPSASFYVPEGRDTVGMALPVDVGAPPMPAGSLPVEFVSPPLDTEMPGQAVPEPGSLAVFVVALGISIAGRRGRDDSSGRRHQS